MSYESWRISFQNSELAAKAAYRVAAKAQKENRELKSLVAKLSAERQDMLKAEGAAAHRHQQELDDAHAKWADGRMLLQRFAQVARVGDMRALEELVHAYDARRRRGRDNAKVVLRGDS